MKSSSQWKLSLIVASRHIVDTYFRCKTYIYIYARAQPRPQTAKKNRTETPHCTWAKQPAPLLLAVIFFFPFFFSLRIPSLAFICLFFAFCILLVSSQVQSFNFWCTICLLQPKSLLLLASILFKPTGNCLMLKLAAPGPNCWRLAQLSPVDK